MPHGLLRRATAAIAALLIPIISPVNAQDEVRAFFQFSVLSSQF
jgi:hypothetical protein